MKNNKKIIRSWKAVGFERTAREKKNPDMIAGILSEIFREKDDKFLLLRDLIKIKPDIIARSVRLITPRSVLLSTNTKNAPIPLISQTRKYIHAILKVYLDCRSEVIIFFSLK